MVELGGADAADTCGEAVEGAGEQRRGKSVGRWQPGLRAVGEASAWAHGRKGSSGARRSGR